jgi:hypothetical protein
VIILCTGSAEPVGGVPVILAALPPGTFRASGAAMREEPMHTRSFVFQCWASFLIALGVSLVGIAWLPIEAWVRAFVLVAYLYTVNGAFTLAKTLRDRHEGRRLLSRLDEARNEEILRRYAGGED